MAKKRRSKNPFKENKFEICYNLINSLIAGILILLGSLTSGTITWGGVGLAVLAAVIVIITKFKEYWDGEKKEYSRYLFNFL